MDRGAGFAGDGSDGFDKGLNRRGWVAMFDQGLLCHAWSARSRFYVLVSVGHGKVMARSGDKVMLGWRGLGSAF